MKKKILIHSIAFSPDGVSTAYLYNDLALRFQKEGFDVVVLTTTPQYNVVESALAKQPMKKRFLGLYYESDFHGIKVKHVYQKKYKKSFFRLLGFIYWHIVSFFLGISEKKIDIILSPSPPLSIGFINILMGRLKRAKVIYNIQEIYPDLLIESGLKSKFVISFLKWLERFIYNHSDAGTTIDKVFYNTIVNRFKDKSKLHIIPNFVDTDLYKPVEKTDLHLDKTLFPETKALKLMYAGNIGIAQDWKTLIHLADNTKDWNIEYFVIGEGAMKDFLVQEKEKLHLNKLHILPYQQRELMPKLIAYSDLQFVFMTPEMDGNGFPSKVYTIMACAKPLLISSGENTPIVNFLKEKKCAEIVSHCKLSERVWSMTNFLHKITKEELEIMGQMGIDEIERNYSKNIVTDKYVNLITNLIE